MQTLVALLPYLLLAVNTVLLLALFLGMNQRVRKLRANVQASTAAAQTEVARVSNGFKDLTNRIGVLEKEERQLGTVEHGAGGLNGTLRGKVLKMHRLGQPADRIAETLRVPRGQVDLLVKVHAIVMRTYQGVAAPELNGDIAKKG
jgi:hypothetical protein